MLVLVGCQAGVTKQMALFFDRHRPKGKRLGNVLGTDKLEVGRNDELERVPIEPHFLNTW